MAIFESVIFSKIRQKLANTVMHRRGSQSIMRGKPSKIRNPKTPDQLTQRAKMKLLIDLSLRFASPAYWGFCGRNVNLSPANAFVSKNMEYVTVDENFVASLDFKNLRCSSGILNCPDVTASFDDENNKVSLTQTEQDADGISGENDVVYVVLYDTVMKASRTVTVGKRSETVTKEFSLPKKWTFLNMYAYSFAVNPQKSRASETLNVELV